MGTKTVTLQELRANDSKKKLYILIQGKVYNVTKFINEHPGGDEVLLNEGGQDATEAFEDVGHSDEARALLPKLFVGDLERDSGVKLKLGATAADESRESGSSMMYFLVPLGLLATYFGWGYYTGSA